MAEYKIINVDHDLDSNKVKANGLMTEIWRLKNNLKLE